MANTSPVSHTDSTWVSTAEHDPDHQTSHKIGRNGESAASEHSGSVSGHQAASCDFEPSRTMSSQGSGMDPRGDSTQEDMTDSAEPHSKGSKGSVTVTLTEDEAQDDGQVEEVEPVQSPEQKPDMFGEKSEISPLDIDEKIFFEKILAQPEDIDDDSASRLEWLRQKRDERAKCRPLDQLMCLVGSENVKAYFLSLKALIDVARRRGEPLSKITLNLLVDGRKGTGKTLVNDLFKQFQVSQGVCTSGRPTTYLSSSSHTITLKDFSDDELHELLKRIIKKRGMDVEGGIDGLYTRALARRIGRGRGSESFGNARAVNEAFAAACDRQACRLQQERLMWTTDGEQGDAPNDYFLTKEDLLGKPPTDIRPSSHAYQALQAMIGLESVKKTVEELMDLARHNYFLEIQGRELIRCNLNRVCLGPPGSGKTTVAKLLGQIIIDLGLVSGPEVVIHDPSDFTSTLVGGDEENTRKILRKTEGKVLIIDNAHGLCPRKDVSRSTSSVDQMMFAILNTIVAKTSSEPGQDRCIILVGYAEEMRDMFYKSNPGLRSRFPLDDAFVLRAYEVSELMAILDARLDKDGIEATEQAKYVASHVLARARDRPAFGNGRDVHHLIDRARASQKGRTSELPAYPIPIRSAEERTALLETNFNKRIVLEPQDFDPHWDRYSGGGQNVKDLFKEFVGFDKVIKQFQGYQEIVIGMRLHGKDPRPNIPFTFVFKGPPGTGKTSTARKLGQIFYDMGFLSSNDVIECSASDLVGEHTGGTGPLVQTFLEKALGKVLFIDEAYRLASGPKGPSAFEEEAIGELVDGLTKMRYARKIVIILAGYSGDMDMLMKANRGLRGRFATEVIFPQLTPEQSLQYLGQLVGTMDIKIRDRTAPSTEKKDKVHRLLTKLSATRDWSNGRDIETLAKVVIGEVFQKEGRRKKKSSQLQVSTDELIESLKEMLRSRLAGELHDSG